MSDEKRKFDKDLVSTLVDEIIASNQIHSYAQLTLKVIACLEKDGLLLSESNKEELAEYLRHLAPLGATDLDDRLYHAARERPWYTAFLVFVLLGTAGATLEYFVQSGLDELISPKSASVQAIMAPVQLKEKSVTVFSFTNITSAQEVDWLSLGLAEAIEGKLAAVANLQIIARPRNDDEKDSFKEAKSLGVLIGVLGSYQVLGEQIQINAKLISLQKDNVIVATCKEQGKLHELFDLQDKIALQIAKSLGFTFTVTQEKEVTKQGTRNLQAFRYFAIGKKLLQEGRTIEAIEQLAKAASYDPTYGAATKELSFIKASAHHIRINNDGSMIYHSMIDFPQWPGGSSHRLNSGVGKIISARDSSGRPLLLDCKPISDKAWKAIFTYPNPPKKGERVRIICEVEGHHRPTRCGELYYANKQFGTSERAQKLFVIEPPSEAELVFLIPLPEAVIEQDGHSYYLFHQFQEDSVYTEWTICYTFNEEAAKSFLALDDKAQREALVYKGSKPSKRMIEQIRPFRMAEAIRLQDFKRAKELIEAIEASKSDYGPFFTHWGRGTMAWAKGKRGQALGFLEAAAETKRRPSHLMDDLFRKIIEFNEERGSAKRVLRLLDKELKRRSWWSHRTFHELPAKDDLQVLQGLVAKKEGGLTALYDLGLQYRRLNKLDEAWKVIAPLLYRQQNPYVIRLACSISVARNDDGKSFALLKKLADKLPLEKAFYYHIAMLIEANRVSDAFRLFRKEAEKEKFRPWIVDDFASKVLAKVKEPQQVLEAAEKILNCFFKANEKLFSRAFILSQCLPLMDLAEPKRELFAKWLISILKKCDNKESKVRLAFKERVLRFVKKLEKVEGLTADDRTFLVSILKTNEVLVKSSDDKSPVTSRANK